MREGLMMDDFPLTVTYVAERAETFYPGREVVFRRPDGTIGRSTFGACARRARSLGAALTELGIRPGDPVATLMWNQPEHLEVYFALPSMGAVLHTLNPRLHPDELQLHRRRRRGSRDHRRRVAARRLRGIPRRAGVRARDRRAPLRGAPARRTARLRGADRRRRADGVAAGATSARPRPSVTRPAPRAGRRASSTRTARSSCTRWSPRCPTPRVCRSRDAVLPVVPMFHANAWGLHLHRRAGRRGAGAPRPAARRRVACSTCSPRSR